MSRRRRAEVGDPPSGTVTSSTVSSGTVSSGTVSSGTARSRPAARRVGRALLVLGALLAPVTSMSVFVTRIVLDTDRYVETVSPLGSDSAVREEAVGRIADALLGAVDVTALMRDALPEDMQILVGPLSAAVRTTVERTTEEILASEAFARLWDDANRLAHRSVRSLLTDVDVVDLPDGRVVVDLSGIAAEVAATLVDRGLSFFADVPITSLAARIELFDASQLEQIQGLVRLARTLVWVMALATAACLVGTIALARDRRRSVAHVGMAVAISGAIALVGIGIARSASLGALDASISRDAAAATFDILTRFLRQALRTGVVIGVLVALGAWGIGPSPRAERLRSLVPRRATATGT